MKKAPTTMKKATTTMKKRKSGSKEGKGGDSPSQLIDARIKELSDWRGETLARIRILIKQADPEVVEEWKWRGVPVWSHAGMICTGETYKNVVKMTFAKGASLEDPSGLFNSSLEGNTRRAIDFHEGDKIDEKALKALIRAAVELNTSAAAQRPGTRGSDLLTCGILIWCRSRQLGVPDDRIVESQVRARIREGRSVEMLQQIGDSTVRPRVRHRVDVHTQYPPFQIGHQVGLGAKQVA